MAAVTEPVAGAPAAGPCPRSELTVDNEGANPRLGRSLAIRTIDVRLTERGYRALRRAVARERGAGVWIEARGADGDRTAGGILVLPRGAS